MDFIFIRSFLKEKAREWFKRVLFLYLFWMLFYSYFWFIPSRVSFFGVSYQLIIGYWHLWYLPGLLGAAVLVMFLSNFEPKIMIYSILLTFFIGVLIQYSGNYHMFENKIIDRWSNFNWVHRNFLFFSMPFFFMGFLINKFCIHKKVSLNVSVILSIIGVIFLLGESYFNYLSPLCDGSFDNYASLLIVCPAVFILFMHMDYRGEGKQLALYATGIYFIHPLFLLMHNKFNYFDETLLSLLVIVLSLSSSYFLIKINNKIKFIL